MMFGLSSFNLINEFERASNESNVEQLASSSARLQPYLDSFLSLSVYAMSPHISLIFSLFLSPYSVFHYVFTIKLYKKM